MLFPLQPKDTVVEVLIRKIKKKKGITLKMGMQN